MLQQPPMLTPEEIEAMQAAQYANSGQPQTVKIFGIMHIVLAVYGVGASALGAYIALVGNPFFQFMPQTPQLNQQIEMQASMQQKILPFTIFSYVMTLTLSVLLLIAGIKLLQKRRSGLAWSNYYAWISVAGKVITAVLTFIYILPTTREMMGTPAIPGAAKSIMETAMIVGTIIGMLIPFTYPILALILLNLKKTKEWFAARPD
jgi:hypothetical protein